MSVRAGIVVTGTEVLSGRVQDRNGLRLLRVSFQGYNDDADLQRLRFALNDLL